MSIFLDEIACIHGLADAEGLIPIQTLEQLVKSTLFVAFVVVCSGKYFKQGLVCKVWQKKLVLKFILLMKIECNIKVILNKVFDAP